MGIVETSKNNDDGMKKKQQTAHTITHLVECLLDSGLFDFDEFENKVLEIISENDVIMNKQKIAHIITHIVECIPNSFIFDFDDFKNDVLKVILEFEKPTEGFKDLFGFNEENF